MKIFLFIILTFLFTSCLSLESLKKNGLKRKTECPTYNRADQVKFDKDYYKCKKHAKVKIHEPKKKIKTKKKNDHSFKHY